MNQSPQIDFPDLMWNWFQDNLFRHCDLRQYAIRIGILVHIVRVRVRVINIIITIIIIVIDEASHSGNLPSALNLWKR